MRVLDGGVVVFDGVAGVEPQSETVWHQADRYGVPRIAFVNKMDRAGASLDATIRSIRERLGARPIAVQMPIGAEADFQGVVDLVRMRAIYFDADGKPLADRTEIPVEHRAEASTRHEALVEALADVSDQVAMEERRRRVDALEAVARRTGEAVRRSMLGDVRPVLWETLERPANGAGPLWSGLTDNYLRVHTVAPAGLDLDNRITPARLVAVDGRVLWADVAL